VVATNNTGTIVFDMALPTSFNFSEETSNVRNGRTDEYGNRPFNSIALDTEFSLACGFFDYGYVNEPDNGTTQAIYARILARRDLSQCEKTASVFAFNHKASVSIIVLGTKARTRGRFWTTQLHPKSYAGSSRYSDRWASFKNAL